MKSLRIHLLVGLISLSNSSFVFGQGHFDVVVSAAPVFTHTRSASALYLPQPNGSLTNIQLRSYSHGVGYSLGVLGRYTFSHHWSASAGLWTTYVKTDGPFFEADALAAIEIETPGSVSHIRNYQIPVLVNYQFSRRRVSPYVSAGSVFSFRATTYYEGANGQEVGFVNSRKKVDVLPTIGIGAIFHATSRLGLVVQPTAQLALPQADYVYFHAYRLGVQGQVLYTL